MRARIDDTNTACRFFFLLLLYSEHLIQMIRPINHSWLLHFRRYDGLASFSSFSFSRL